MDEGPEIDVSAAKQFDPLEVQLKSFYTEISTISAKKPDGPVSRFKLNFINQTLQNVNKVLGDAFLPFPDFRQFDEVNLPTASDVAIMLAQYLKCMDRFYRAHTDFDEVTRHTYWRTKSAQEGLRAIRTK